ncbi:guanylate kinase [bacterium]|nr:guanylate kinase [bacterium]MBU1637169.1 guanylate kinase [bacterium]MBU1919265.1 guanylate kinase [bacterium]
MSSRGRLIVFASPSGGGKGTVIRQLLDQHPDWGFSCSATTRAPRPGEEDGKHYYFLNRDEFQRRVAAGEFLEHEAVHSDLYGTLKSVTQERLEQGETVIFDLDVKGALSVKRHYPEAFSIFIVPPSMAVLEQRLRGRKTESEEVIRLRLTRAAMELGLADQFDVRIVNDVLEQTVADVEQAIANRFA